MQLSEEEKCYSQKGKKYRYTVGNDYWDLVVQGVRYHSDGHTLWLDTLSMKNSSGNWSEDGTQLSGLIYGVQTGNIKEIHNMNVSEKCKSGQNHEVVAKFLYQTLVDINALLGSSQPENWTKDGIFSQIQKLQRIEADHEKKSNQVVKLTRKLKSKTRMTIKRSVVAGILSDKLRELNQPVDPYDYSYRDQLVSEQKGAIRAVEDCLDALRGCSILQS